MDSQHLTVADCGTTEDIPVFASAQHHSSTSDQDAQRGRKRRRSPFPFTSSAKQPSGDSSTLRGRCRHRSTSLMNFSSRNASRNLRRDTSCSPSRKRLLRIMRMDRRRSQSPSRSQSPMMVTTMAMEAPALSSVVHRRRRHRTRSHSRDHNNEAACTSQELMSPLKYSVVAKEEEEEDTNG